MKNIRSIFGPYLPHFFISKHSELNIVKFLSSLSLFIVGQAELLRTKIGMWQMIQINRKILVDVSRLVLRAVLTVVLVAIFGVVMVQSTCFGGGLGQFKEKFPHKFPGQFSMSSILFFLDTNRAFEA